jgi:hypothetical protein
MIRECIYADRIVPACFLHLSLDLPCIPIALPAADIKKPFPVTSTRKGRIHALDVYHRCQP